APPINFYRTAPNVGREMWGITMSIAETIFRLAVAGPYARFCWGYLSERERAPVTEIHDASKTDWWPVKAGLDELKRMGLAEVKDDVWSLTDFGRKVRDVQRTMAGVRVV
ncbi:unnamed protein product, partial [marine sediment metagenome]